MEEQNGTTVSIKHWSIDDMPRSKLLQCGASALSDSELLSILINTGTRDKTALDISKHLLNSVGHNLNELAKRSLCELMKFEGIGESKAALLCAAIELGRRRHSSRIADLPIIRTSAEVAEYLKTVMQDLSYEVFGVMFLNRANKIKHFEIMSRGGITGTVADPRLILKRCIELEATSIILSHNHPSGNLRPSKADEELTQKIKSAAAYIDVKLLDHIIVSDEGFCSLADEGLL
jgi:DNA repair protein RadC